MVNIEIYTKQHCPYCDRAKQLLTHKNVTWTEYAIDEDEDKREEMMRRSGLRTVPQIFINGKSIGGFDDLNKLNQEGALDQLLAG